MIQCDLGRVSCTQCGAMAKGAVERRRGRARRVFERLGMESQRVELENGATLHCWVPPAAGGADRPPLLLVHGFGWDGMTTWEMQLQAFLEAEFAVFVPDLVFFGESTAAGIPRHSPAFQADCLAAMLRHLGVHSGVNVVGTSYGGLVTFHMASMFPALLHQVVIASSGVCMDAADGAAVLQKYNFDDMKKILLPTIIEEVKDSFRFILPNVPRLPDSHYEELLEAIYLKNRDSKVLLYDEAGFATDKALSRPTLTQVKEVLLVWGENDRLFDVYQGLKLKMNLGNGAELVVIKDAGHTPQSEAPRAFNNAVLAFLKDRRLPQSRL